MRCQTTGPQKIHTSIQPQNTNLDRRRNE